jgi:hypothetical protein
MMTITRPCRMLAACAWLWAGVACAQADGTVVRVRAGTEVRLVLDEALSSEDARKDQVFRLEVDEDVRTQGHVVIPRGTPAEGVVVRAQAREAYGKPGVLQLKVLALHVGDRRIPLFFTMLKQGKDGDAGMVWLSAAFGPLGGVVHGKSVTIPRGTPLLVHVDQDVDLPVAEAAAAIPATIPGGMHADATIQQGDPNATQTHD